jgi:segregation and condensation protein A
MVSFDVDLPCYHGPLDLLLYLIRREELDIESIQLSRIAHQYCQYIEVLALLDLENVSEFIDVMSQLMETKADRVLPQAPSQEVDQGPQHREEQDSNLVERLLQYKRFRDLASLLDEQSRQWQLRYGRLRSVESNRRTSDAELPIAKIEVWDLVSAFGRILKSKFNPPTHEISYDSTPIQVYMQRIHQRLAGGDSIELQDFFETGMHKSALIATFLATLELTRYHGVQAIQRDADGALILQRGDSFPAELFVTNEED